MFARVVPCGTQRSALTSLRYLLGPHAVFARVVAWGTQSIALTSLCYLLSPRIGTAKRSSDGGPAKLVVGGFAPHTPLLVAQLQKWLRWGRGPWGGTMLVS